MTNEIALICWHYVPQILNRINWTLLIKSKSLNNQHKSISFFYPQDNSLSWVWYIFSIYIFLLFYGTCGNMYNLLFLICALKFMQIALLYLYHEKNTVYCIFTQQSGLNLSMLVSIFEILPFDCCIITSIFKYHSLIEGHYHWKINVLFLL